MCDGTMSEPRSSWRPRAATFGLLLVASVFAASVAISWRNNRRLADNDAQILRAQSTLTVLEEVLATVTEAEARERGFLITGDDSYLQGYHTACERVPKTFDRLADLIGDDSNWRDTLASLREDVDARIEELDAAIALRKTAGFEAARHAVASNNGRRLMREMRRLVDKIQAHQRVLLVKRGAESRRTLHTVAVIDLVDMLLGISTVALAYFLFRRERRLRECADDASRRLAGIVESSDDAIVGETLEGTIVSWNAGAERVYGYTAAEAIGQAVLMICPPEETDHARQIREKIYKGERVEPFESQRRRKDGSRITVSISVSPIRDARGKVIGVSRISRDITEQRHLQREVLDIAAREQQRIGQDLHDGTGQELTGLIMLASDLREDLDELGLPQAAAAGKVVNGMEEALEHVRLLSKGLLPVVVDADGLMAALSDLAARTDELSALVCEFHCEEPISIDDNRIATQLFRLAQEAVTNALRHAAAKRIVIAMRAISNLVILSIADDGRGMVEAPDEVQGSGLRIMRYRAQLAGAKLEVASNRPRGTVVTCTLAVPRPARSHADAIGDVVALS